MLNEGTDEAYIVSPGFRRRTRALCVLVAVKDGANEKEISQAYFHASLMSHIMARHGVKRRGKIPSDDLVAKLEVAEEETSQTIEECWGTFEQLTSAAGWDLSKAGLPSEGYKIQISSTEKKTS